MNTTNHYKTVNDSMHVGAVTCVDTTPIRQVMALLTAHGLHALPVVDQRGYLVGVISQTDLVHARQVQPQWEIWEELPVGRLMTPYVVTIRADESESMAIRKLSENQIHRLVVVEEDEIGKRPIGILSMTDVVRSMAM